MAIRAVHPEDLRSGLRSTGSHERQITVHAFCQCGWEGPRHRWGPGARQAETADLEAHQAATGHQSFPDGYPPADGYHMACDHFHQLNDHCPVPPDSPRGQVERLAVGSSTDPAQALDRLAAAHQLRAWLDDQETQAAIGARLARCTWNEMGQAIGATRQAAWNRWGQMMTRYEAAGLLHPDQTAAAP